MAVNLKLTRAIKDRIVQNFQLNASVLLINFVDGSKMTVTIVECNSPPLQEGARIRQIFEDQTKLLFECEDDSTLDVTIVEPGNSVIVRDKKPWSRISRISCGHSHLPKIAHKAGIVVTDQRSDDLDRAVFDFPDNRGSKFLQPI